jgi:diacylglycerol kinase
MNQLPEKPRSWPQKFRDAFRGVGKGARGQSSFQVHVFCAVAVIVVAALANMSAWQWCTLLLCVVIVLVAEMFNSALEAMARAVGDEYHPQLRDALDIASGAVLLSAIGAVVIGSIVLANALL